MANFTITKIFVDTCSACGACRSKAGKRIDGWHIAFHRPTGPDTFSFELCGSASEPDDRTIMNYLKFVLALPIDPDDWRADTSPIGAPWPSQAGASMALRHRMGEFFTEAELREIFPGAVMPSNQTLVAMERQFKSFWRAFNF